jgi:hypothetical protein
MLLGVVVCLSAPGRVSGGSVPATTVHLRRYFLLSYSIVDEKGKPSEADMGAKLAFKDAVKEWLPEERILMEDPKNCTLENPCDKIVLREEEESGTDRRKLIMRLEPDPAESTKINHAPSPKTTTNKSSVSRTEQCLYGDEATVLKAHDMAHQSELSQ